MTKPHGPVRQNLTVTPRFDDVDFIQKRSRDRAQNAVVRDDLLMTGELVVNMQCATECVSLGSVRKNLPLTLVLHTRRAWENKRLQREGPNTVDQHDVA